MVKNKSPISVILLWYWLGFVFESPQWEPFPRTFSSLLNILLVTIVVILSCLSFVCRFHLSVFFFAIFPELWLDFYLLVVVYKKDYLEQKIYLNLFLKKDFHSELKHVYMHNYLKDLFSTLRNDFQHILPSYPMIYILKPAKKDNLKMHL